MSSPGKRPASYEDLLRVPDNMVAEILDGELFASPRPSLPHSLASSALGSELGSAFQRGRGGPGGWWILDEPELHLGADVVVPDLAGWRRSRLLAVPAEPFLTLTPDWVGEVVAPSTERIDRVRKLAIYAREGVGHAWLVNPGSRILEVFRLEVGKWVLLGTHGGDERARAEPFDAIELDLLALWGEERTEEGR